MSEAFTIKMEGKGETATRLGKLYQDGRLPLGLHSALAKAVAEKVKQHLKLRDHTHANRLGGKRSHFYFQAAESVRGTPTVDGAEVTINKLGLRQRWLGGTIRAKNAKLLAIPARAEAVGVSPRNFPGDLKFIKFRSGAMALVKVGGPRSRTAGLVEYWLKEEVYQRPDPTVLPTPAELINVASEAMGDYLSQNE
jgi:hypothetical protein